MFDLEKIIRPNILSLVPYSSARSEYSDGNAVFLDANENPFNQPYNRYPDPLQKELKEKIAAIKGINPGRLFLGNGSDEAIDLLIRAFCEPGKDNIISMDPSYGMYDVCAEINGIQIYKVLLGEKFELNSRNVIRTVNERTKLIFLCSPNNPTSNSFDRQEVLNIINHFSGLIIIDEAYIDFAGHKGYLDVLDKHINLVLLQTFSKAWGMAGVRLGIALADDRIINILNKIKYPYNISVLTQKIALEMLENTDQKDLWVERILEQRRFMAQSVDQLSFVLNIYPSDANFLLVKVKDPDNLYKYLVDNKIIVRNRSRLSLCEGCLRITIGSKTENIQLLKSLQDYESVIQN